jgi:hypothetical protein
LAGIGVSPKNRALGVGEFFVAAMAAQAWTSFRLSQILR